MWGMDIAPEFVADYLSGIPYTGSTNVSSLPYVPIPVDPRTTEDCLFLDVLTPKDVLTPAKKHSGKKVPVLVWIYGGGYSAGDKTFYGGPALVQRSMGNGDKGIILVAINYRVCFDQFVCERRKLRD
jgi:carboxylesterase type B